MIEIYEVKSYSHSRNETYGKCPYLYKRKHLDKIDLGPGLLVTDIGLETHDYFQEYYETIDTKKLYTLSDMDLYDFIISFFKETIPRDRAQMELVAVIQGFTDLECDRIVSLRKICETQEKFDKYYLPVLTEELYEFEYEFEVTKGSGKKKVTIAKIKTTMRIKPDAIFLNPKDDTHMILDWKTGYAKPSIEGSVGRQLYIYLFFLYHIKVKDRFGNLIEPKGMCVVFPRYTTVLYKERNERAENTVIRGVANRLYKAAQEIFDCKPSLFNCRWDKPREEQCPLWETECKPKLEEDGFFDNERENENDDDEDNNEQDNEENEWEEEDPPVYDFSEGNWDATS